MSEFAFTAANTFPLKVLLHRQLASVLYHKRRVVPVHVQLNPTNRCNFCCDFCSCSGRDRNLELSVENVVELMREARGLGCQSVTITGGGEPLKHEGFVEVVEKLKALQLQLGMVSNGSLIGEYPDGFFDRFVWFRVSAGDLLGHQLKHAVGTPVHTVDGWLTAISKYCVASPNCDWAFSYVVGEHPNFKLIKRLVEFANGHGFSHVRIVNNILKADKLVDAISSVKRYLVKNKVDDKIVNYQSRSSYTRGVNPCYISLLKPVIDAQGFILPCCGTQYALANPTRNYESSMRMGWGAEGLRGLIDNQAFFDGRVCVKCYYSGYNTVLHHMLNGIQHSNFV